MGVGAGAYGRSLFPRQVEIAARGRVRCLERNAPSLRVSSIRAVAFPYSRSESYTNHNATGAVGCLWAPTRCKRETELMSVNECQRRAFESALEKMSKLETLAGSKVIRPDAHGLRQNKRAVFRKAWTKQGATRAGAEKAGWDGDSTGWDGIPTGRGDDFTGRGGDFTGPGGDPTGLDDDPIGRDGDPTGRLSFPLGRLGFPTGRGGIPAGWNGVPRGRKENPTGSGEETARGFLILRPDRAPRT